MGEEQLLRTIIRMTSPHTDPTKSRYKFIVIDFSWCTSFRWEFAQDIFKDLDDLFGFYMVYQYSNLFPIMSILLFQDRFGLPKQSPNDDPYPGKRCIYGPKAWQEEMRQKVWTLRTIMMIQLAVKLAARLLLYWVKVTIKWCCWRYHHGFWCCWRYYQTRVVTRVWKRGTYRTLLVYLQVWSPRQGYR